MPTTLVGPNGQTVKVSNEGELFTHSRTIETMAHINQHEGKVWTLPFDALNPDATDKNSNATHEHQLALDPIGEPTAAGFTNDARQTNDADD